MVFGVSGFRVHHLESQNSTLELNFVQETVRVGYCPMVGHGAARKRYHGCDSGGSLIKSHS